MRKLIGVAAIVFMISALAMAGEAPRPEIYGGYRFTSTDGGWHGSGLNTGANLYLTRWLAGTADFGSGFSSGSKLYSYTFGPTISMQRKNFTPFAHALFGGAHASAGSIGTSGMAMMFGGGVDVGSRKLALRAVQFDWLTLRFSGVTDKNNMRVTTGILYRF